MFLLVRIPILLGLVFGWLLPFALPFVHRRFGLRIWWVAPLVLPLLCPILLMVHRRSGTSSAFVLKAGLNAAIAGSITLWLALTSSLFLVAILERRSRAHLGFHDLSGAFGAVACAGTVVLVGATNSAVAGIASGLLLVPPALLWAAFYGHRAEPEVAALGASWFVLTGLSTGLGMLAQSRYAMLQSGAWPPWTGLELLGPIGVFTLTWVASGLERPQLPAVGLGFVSVVVTVTWWDMRLFHHMKTNDDVPRVKGVRGPSSSIVRPRSYRWLPNTDIAEASHGPRAADFDRITPLSELEGSWFVLNRGMHAFSLTGEGTVWVDRREDGWHVGEVGPVDWERALEAVHGLPSGESIEVAARRSITLQDLVDLCSAGPARPCRVDGLPVEESP